MNGSKTISMEKEKTERKPAKTAMQRKVSRMTSDLRGKLSKDRLYSKDLDMQLGIVAVCNVKIRQIMEKMSEPDYDLLQTEFSREGNPRSSINPLENLLMRYIQLMQAALRGTGLNADSKRVASGEADDRDEDLISKADEWEKAVK